jgi:hypothetical protein
MCSLAAAALLLLGSCATIPPELAPGVPRRPPGPEPEIRARWQAQKVKRYTGYVRRALLPRLAEDIIRIKRKGYLASVSEFGLDHVHLRYPRLPDGPQRYFVTAPADWHHLHYHGVENISASAGQWRGEMIEVATGGMKRWLVANAGRQFDYERFFYGDGAYIRPEPIPRSRLKAYARRWWKLRAEPGGRPTDARYRMLVARASVVAGPDQVGYSEGARRILAARSIVVPAPGSAQRPPVPVPVGTRFLDGFYHPVTVRLSAPQAGPPGARPGAYEPCGGSGGYECRIHVLEPE